MPKSKIEYVIISSLNSPDDFEKTLISHNLKKDRYFCESLPGSFFRFKHKDPITVFRGTDFLRPQNKELRDVFKSLEIDDEFEDEPRAKVFQMFFREKFKSDNIKLKFFIHWGGGDPLTYRRYENNLRRLFSHYSPSATKPDVTSISYANPFFKEILSSRELTWKELVFKLEWASSSSNLYANFERVLLTLIDEEENNVVIKQKENEYLFNELTPIWSLVKDNQGLLKQAEFSEVIQLNKLENSFLIKDKPTFRKLLKRILTEQGAELRPF